MLFFRVFTHLLPQATAWRVTFDKMLRRYLQGLAQAPSDLCDFVDRTWLELFADTTTELDRWETHFGLTKASTEDARRLNVAAAWSAQGGQSPSYLQTVVRAAGFDVYLYEWWSSGPPYVARDPRTKTELPQIGTVQCGPVAPDPNPDPDPRRQCTSLLDDPPDVLPAGVDHEWELYPQCNRFLINNPGYLVNNDLTGQAPPPVPDDPNTWPYFVYWAGETFDTRADIPAARREEFERLLLKLCPAHCWIVTFVNYVA